MGTSSTQDSANGSLNGIINGFPNGSDSDASINNLADRSVKDAKGLRIRGGDYSCPQDDKLEPLAVVGFSLKFPQEATTPQAFWKMLTEKRCAVTEWPKDRLNIDAFYHLDSSRPDTVEYPFSIQASMLMMTILDSISRRSFPQGISRQL